MERALAPLRSRAAHIRANLAQLQQIKAGVAHLQSLHEQRTAWLQFFAGLQEQMVKEEDVWLEKLQTVPSEEGKPLKLAISGRMLDRSNATSTGSAETFGRVKNLLAGIHDLPGILAVEGERFDRSEPGLLRFDFVLMTNPAHPF